MKAKVPTIPQHARFVVSAITYKGQHEIQLQLQFVLSIQPIVRKNKLFTKLGLNANCMGNGKGMCDGMGQVWGSMTHYGCTGT